MIKYLSKVLYALSGSRAKLVLLLLTFVLTSILEALGIGLIGPFISLASRPESIEQSQWLSQLYIYLGLKSSSQFIGLLGLAIAAIFIIKSALYFCAKAYIIKFSFDQKGKLCSRLLSAYLSVPYTFHLSRNTAALINNIVVETNKFCNGCLMQLLNVISNLAITFVLLILLFKTSPLFLSIILAAFLILFMLFHWIGKRARIWGKQGSEAQKEIIRIINHSLGGLKETRVIGCEPYFENQMDKQIHILERSVTLFQASQLLPRISLETILVLAIVGFVSIFAIQQSGVALTSVLSVFAVASIRLIPSVSQFIQGITSLQNNAYILDMLYHDLKELEKLNLPKRTRHLNRLQKPNSSSIQQLDSQMSFTDSIELKQINYGYPGTQYLAIDDVSLTIRKGQSIALIGKSGAGKTTLADIILGLLTPEKGDICVDGVSIYNDLRSWQNLIGYIPQSIFLTDDTIEQNIAFGVADHQINLERLDKAVKAAQLGELVEKLPDGMKTYVGERGIRLSGGQRQRIGIARALYHEREILVLDEATAALDNETESLVSSAIQALSGQKTMIIIAHRLSTVKHCDCIYVMEQGRIAKSGNYQDVVLTK